MTTEHLLIEQLHSCAHHLRHKGRGKFSQSRILSILSAKGNMTQRELMHILRISSAALSEILLKIETDGYIERRRSETDKRNVDIFLTETGRGKAEQHLNEYNDIIPSWFAPLNDADKKELNRLLSQLLTAWQTEDDDAPEHRCQNGHHGHRRHGHKNRYHGHDNGHYGHFPHMDEKQC